MKKVALLLGALALVSSVAYAKEVVPAVEEVVVVEEVKAQPALRVTSVGQFIAVENTSRAEDIGEAVHFGNTVGLAYGDNWTFDLMARKTWSMDTDDGIHSNGHRMEFGFWRNFENFSIGAQWRGEQDLDRYLAKVKYNYGMFSGDLAVGYKFYNQDANDAFYAEGLPVAVSYGPLKVGYYFEYAKFNGTEDKAHDKDVEALHQVRAYFPIYSTERLSLTGEYRYQFAHDVDYTDDKTGEENNRHIGIVSANYAMTDALSINTYYQYEWNKYEKHDDVERADNYYGEFGLGWTYSF